MIGRQEPSTRGRPVAVVRLIVSDRQGRVLILRRSDAEEPAWCLPGGRVEEGETIEAAAARELKEETGLRLAQCRFLFDQDSPPTLPGGTHVLNTYLECAVEGDVILNAESQAYVWVAERDLSGYRMVFGSGQGLLQYWSLTPPRRASRG